MTDIRKLMEEATPGIAWLDDDSVHKGEHCKTGCVYGFVPHMGKTRIRADGNRESLNYAQSLADAELICRAVNALPAVLELMAELKTYYKFNDTQPVGNIMDRVRYECMKEAYDALTRALGVEE